MSTFRRLVALLAALGLFFAACGDDDDVNTDDPAGQVEDEMDDDMDDGGSEDDMESEDEMDDMESEDDMDDMESEDDTGDDEMEDEGDS